MSEQEPKTKVLVCGGRDFWSREAVFRELDALDPQPTVIVHGAARGVDSFAASWAKERGVAAHGYPADWNAYGRSAGPRRNSWMLKKEQPDMVIAFDGGLGTSDMVRKAKAAGVPVVEVGR